MISKKKVQFKHLSAFLIGIFLSPLPIFATSWTTPVTISSTTSDQPNIAVDPSGNAYAIWQGYDGNNYVIQTARLPSLGNWSSPTTLSVTGQDAQNPKIGVDILGNVVSIWSRYDGTSSIIQSSQLPLLGSWTAPFNISATGGNADSCLLSMDDTSLIKNAVAVWHRFNGTNFIIQGAYLTYGGSWSSPANISASGQDAIVPIVAIDSSGNSVITCSQYDGTNFNTKSATQLYTQPWGPNFTLSIPGHTVGQPTVDVSYSGNATFLWSEFDGTNHLIKVSSLPFGGTWTSPITISPSGEDSYLPLINIDPPGNGRAIWVNYNGSNYVVQAANVSTTGTWATPTTISPTGYNVGSIDLAVDSSGNVIAMWDLTVGEISKVQSSTLPAGGSWSTPVDVSTPGVYAYFPALKFDSSGNAVAIWLESNGTTYVVKGSTLATSILGL
jgi:hypothetical protein